MTRSIDLLLGHSSEKKATFLPCLEATLPGDVEREATLPHTRPAATIRRDPAGVQSKGASS